MNCKAKGSRNERKSREILEAAGYLCMKAGASLGVFDIIGIGRTDIILCQVKTRDWPGSVETENIKNFPAPRNARKLVHRWRNYARVPDVKEIR